MPTNNQGMTWVRLLNEHDDAVSEVQNVAAELPVFDVTEYEIVSEKEIHGELDFGNVYIRSYNSRSLYDKSLWSYYVRVETPIGSMSPDVYTWQEASEDGYYSKGYLYELVDLLALISRSRFYIVSVTHINPSSGKPIARHVPHFHYTPCSKYLDLKLFTNVDEFRWSQSIGYLGKVAYEFDSDLHKYLVLSLQLYHSGLRFIGSDHELAYIFLVSSIEALLSQFRLSNNDDIAEYDDVKGMINQSNFDNDIKNELKNHYFHRKIGRKFLRFIEKYSKGFIKGGNYSKRSGVKIRRSQLVDEREGRVVAIYRARSKFLHEGRRMYLPEVTELAAKEDWDIDPSSGEVIVRRRFTESEKLPYIHFFEGLVRHCILNYIEEKSS